MKRPAWSDGAAANAAYVDHLEVLLSRCHYEISRSLYKSTDQVRCLELLKNTEQWRIGT